LAAKRILTILQWEVDVAAAAVLPTVSPPKAAERVNPKRTSHTFGLAAGPPQESNENNSKLSRVIAIVEDDVDISRAYAEIVERLGYPRAFVALNGRDMLNALADRNLHPDVVLIDYRMPGMNGLELGKKVHEVLPMSKIIITTADDSVRNEAMSYGFHFLQKPFSMLQLSRALVE
jgi:CheY-like chemotaxis protein